MINVKMALTYLLAVSIVVGGLLAFGSYFEWHAPVISIHLDNGFIGTRPVAVTVEERGRGLKRVSVGLQVGAVKSPLLAEEYDTPVMNKELSISISPDQLQGKEGPAVFTVTARDRSYWGFFRGNESTQQLKVVVDLTPPQLHLLNNDRYVNFGGAGLILYQSSSDTVSSGVQIGRHFFRGYRAKLKAPDTYMAFFAHPYDAGQSEGTLIAQDAAGNRVERALAYTVQNVQTRRKKVHISDRLIETRVLPLLGGTADGKKDYKDAFLAVNHRMRARNEAQITEVCRVSQNEMLWSEPFHQLSNSKVEANFGDERIYYYKGVPIDRAYHLGYDLAVTRNYPIEAANSGVVAFADDLGIYGRTVIIDHGLGLFTLYGHMSSIDVKKGEKVERKQVIGRTGETGLTTGDHLHYSTLIQGVPVLPLEWWDPRWVQQNVLVHIQDGVIG